MIIRNRRSAFRNICEEGNEIFDIELLRLVLQRHGMHLFFVALSAGVIVYLALKMLTPTLFSPQHRVPLYRNPESFWGFPKSGIVTVDSNLSEFDPEQTLKKIFDGDFRPERLRAYFEPEGFSLTGCDSGGLSSGFEIRPADGSWSARMKAELIQLKKKPSTLLMWGPVPKENLEKITKTLARFLNEEVGQRYLCVGRDSRGEIVKAISESEKSHRIKLARIRALPDEAPESKRALMFEESSEWSKKKASADELIKDLDQSSLPIPIFEIRESLDTSPRTIQRVAVLCLGASAGACLAGLLYFLCIGAPSRIIFGEAALGAIHLDASIYSLRRDADKLQNLLSASLAYAGSDKCGKLAAFVPQVESSLIEHIRVAAEKSGRSFGVDGSKDSEVTLFSSSDPSDCLSSLPHRGFSRILLSAKQGKALKSLHLLYQAEADLSGLAITDVVLVDD